MAHKGALFSLPFVPYRLIGEKAPPEAGGWDKGSFLSPNKRRYADGKI